MLYVVIVILLCFSCKSTNIQIDKRISGCDYYYDKKLKKEVYLTYGTPPKYIRGNIFFAKGIVSNMEVKNINRYESYKVLLRLIIDENGNILDVIILERHDQEKDINSWSSTEREVINSISKMEKGGWIPAKCRNIAVASSIFFPVHFNIRFESEQ